MPTAPVQPQGAADAALAANLRGAGWMLLSVVGATGMTVFVRQLTPELHTSMIAFLRSVVGLLFLAPLLLPGKASARPRIPSPLSLKRPGLHLIRGLLIAVAINLGFYAIWTLPLAVATILFFLAPVFSTMLAPLMLGEHVGPRRWVAVGVGFLGALVVLRPGFEAFEIGAAAAAASSLCFALALLIGKIAARADGANAVFATSGLLSAVMTLPLALPFWELPSAGWVWFTLVLLAAASSLRGYADIRALAAAEASFVAPVSYLRLPAAALAGWALFGETVDGWTWAGAAIVMGAALFIALRERALGKATRRAAAAGPPSLGD